MTKEQALGELRALGVPLDQKDVDELDSAADGDVTRVVLDWLALVETREPVSVLDDIVRIMKQVPEWLELAARIVKLVAEA
jgi:hypothetical protein